MEKIVYGVTESAFKLLLNIKQDQDVELVPPDDWFNKVSSYRGTTVHRIEIIPGGKGSLGFVEEWLSKTNNSESVVPFLIFTQHESFSVTGLYEKVDLLMLIDGDTQNSRNRRDEVLASLRSHQDEMETF